MTTKTEQAANNPILIAMFKRFPCEALPYGELSKLAKEFNVSRERVRQIARANGFDGSHRVGIRADKIMCGRCGKVLARVPKDGGLCIECRWIELPCVYCGTILRRRVSDLVRNVSSGLQTARVFCSRQHRAEWSRGKGIGGGGLGAHNKGPA